jgi:integrase
LPEIEGGSFVFTNDGHHPLSLTAPFARLAATIGVADWRLHDLRRTARTLLSRAGVISDVAEMCLGHVLPGAVRQIYDRHRYEAEKAQAYEALAAQIERVVNPQADALKVVRLR